MLKKSKIYYEVLGMNIEIMHYPKKRICQEFYDIIEFLKKYGATGYNKNWHWARWEWLLGHMGLDESTLPKIGLFRNNGKIVGLVTHDMRTAVYILCKTEYGFIKPQMVDFARKSLSCEGISSIYVDENDIELISIVEAEGYSQTSNSEYVLELDCNEKHSYSLDDDFNFTDYYTTKNLTKYVEVIHKGFENEGSPMHITEADIPERPHYNPKLALFAVAPNGEYAAHCGMWYSPDTEICYVEPVATIPEYRKRGLGKAVVLECINRCVEMGAKKALVISNQQFYYSLGFKDYSIHRLWEKNKWSQKAE